MRQFIILILTFIGLICCSLNSTDVGSDSDSDLIIFCQEEPCTDTLEGFVRIGPFQEDVPAGDSHIAEVIYFDGILFAKNARGDLFRRDLDSWQQLPIGPVSYMGAMTIMNNELYVAIEDGEILKLNSLGETIGRIELPDRELWCEAKCVLKGIQRVGNSIIAKTTSFKERTLDRYFLLDEQGEWKMTEGIVEYGFGSFRSHFLVNDSVLYGASFGKGVWKLNDTQWSPLKPVVGGVSLSVRLDGVTYYQDTSYIINWGGVASLDDQLYATTYNGFLYEINDDTLQLVDVPNKWFYSFGLDTLCGNIVNMNTGFFWNKDDNHWLRINGVDSRDIYESSRYDKMKKIALNSVFPDKLHPGGTVWDFTSNEDTLFFAVGDSQSRDSIRGSVVSFPKSSTPFCNPGLLE